MDKKDYFYSKEKGKYVYIPKTGNQKQSRFGNALIYAKNTPIDEMQPDKTKPLLDEIKNTYTNFKVVGKGTEGLIIAAYCQELDYSSVAEKLKRGERKPNVAIKFSLPPDIPKEESEKNKQKSNDPINALLEKIKGSKTKPQKKYEYLNKRIQRFTRSIGLNHKLYDIWKKEIHAKKFIIIPKVHSQQSSPFLHYVMDYYPGPKLLNYCKLHESETKIINMYIRIIKGIDLVFHDYAIIHTDLKVENIVCDGDIPVILDYGTAKDLRDNEEQITDSEQIVATQRISTKMQIEYSKGRSFYEDIFQLGILFWVMFNRGYPVYPGNWRELKTEEIYDPSILPEKFRNFFMKCINQHQEENRYNSIKELIHGFDAAYRDFKNIGKPGTIINKKTINRVYPSTKKSFPDNWQDQAKKLIKNKELEPEILTFIEGLQELC